MSQRATVHSNTNRDVEAAAIPIADVYNANTHHRRGTRYNDGLTGTQLIIMLLIGFSFLYTVASITTIPPAHVGLVSMFGSVQETTLEPGLNFVSPFASVITFNTKTLLLYSENIVPTQEGNCVSLCVSV